VDGRLSDNLIGWVALLGYAVVGGILYGLQ
jgi:hypothetical protein